MKKIFLTLLIFTLPSFLIAKKSSQLVFKRTATMIPTNQVFYKPDSARVWKIESIIPASVSSNKYVYLKLNQTAEIQYTKFTPTHGPIWISHTDSISFRYSSGTSALVSILEFEVVN